MNHLEMELLSIPNMDGNERIFLNNALGQLEGDQRLMAIQLYKARRKDPQMMLIATAIGFVGIAGIQRLLLGQIGMGILYLLTAGLCCVGTIIDLINIQKMTLEYNTTQASEVVITIKAMKELSEN
ncbi:MAG: TM2 domain-containing membrane protein YozV [Limisphaerales bacterium]|jgi:TM2 domain-containing membrane protein YozV